MDELENAVRSPEAARRWLETWLGKASGGEHTPRPEDLEEVLEAWWRTLGVVPAQRYRELEKQHEELKKRLEESEATVRKLRQILRAEGAETAQEAAAEVLDRWERTTREVLDAQAQIAESWSRTWFGHTPKGGS